MYKTEDNDIGQFLLDQTAVYLSYYSVSDSGSRSCFLGRSYEPGDFPSFVFLTLPEHPRLYLRVHP